MERYLNVDLTYDKDFKLFLKSSKGVCTRFLHDFIPDLKKDNAQVVEFRDPTLLSKLENLKSPILDVLAETSNRGRVNIELQNEAQLFFAERSVYYGSRAVGESLVEGAKYDAVYKTYVLALVDFIMFKERSNYYTHFALLATDDVKLRLSDCLQFVFVEMGKFMRAYRACDLASFIMRRPPEGGAVPTNRNRTRQRAYIDNRGLWVYIIKMTPYLTAEHRKLIAARDKVMEEAMGIIEQLDKRKGHDRIIAEAKEKAERDDWARKAYQFDQGLTKGRQEGVQLGIVKGRQEGREEGREEGARQRQLDMARRMLRAGEPIGKICEFTQLSEAELRKL